MQMLISRESLSRPAKFELLVLEGNVKRTPTGDGDDDGNMLRCVM